MYQNQFPNPLFEQRISVQQAQKIALSHVDGQILHVDMDLQQGDLIYEIFILSAHHTFSEVKIYAKSGKVVSVMNVEEEKAEPQHE